MYFLSDQSDLDGSLNGYCTNECATFMHMFVATDHKQDLEKAIISETSGHFKRLLVSLLTVRSLIRTEKRSILYSLSPYVLHTVTPAH